MHVREISVVLVRDVYCSLTQASLDCTLAQPARAARGGQAMTEVVSSEEVFKDFFHLLLSLRTRSVKAA